MKRVGRDQLSKSARVRFRKHRARLVRQGHASRKKPEVQTGSREARLAKTSVVAHMGHRCVGFKARGPRRRADILVRYDEFEIRTSGEFDPVGAYWIIIGNRIA